ncbi:TPA: helix-turn-helix transcriptional regulator [Klebsiella quasipneumoniae subsp. similipneumoniae]|nr:helix-turn-helix transcriptional regulator [Klebsiella quasipneumoniae subsp. similipneumoniae]
MRSKFLDTITSINNKKELIVASNNPFILTGLESLITPDFYSVRYIPLQEINKLSFNKKYFSVAIVLTGAMSASQLADIIIFYRYVEKARIPTLLFSEMYNHYLSLFTRLAGGYVVYGKQDRSSLPYELSCFIAADRYNYYPSSKRMSDIEAYVLAYTLKGNTVHDIAKMLNTAIKTVYSHQRNIMKKLGVKKIKWILIH